MFPSAEEATLFLGTLDTLFLFSYAVVSFRIPGFLKKDVKGVKKDVKLPKFVRDFEFADQGEISIG